MKSLSVGIVLSSVVLAGGMLAMSANARTLIYRSNSNSQFLPTTNQPSSTDSTQSTNKPSATDNTQSTSSFASIEQAVHTQINEYRKQRGLSPLTINKNISDIARTHSQNMANGTVGFSHNGFQERVQAISTTISYSSAAENVAYNMGYTDPATKAVQGWLNSSGHLKNIQGDYNLTGIGVAKNAKGEYYFTQLFIRSR